MRRIDRPYSQHRRAFTQNEVAKVLSIVGLEMLTDRTRFMLCPPRAPQDKRHYLNQKGIGWTAAKSTLVGTIDADGETVPNNELRFDSDWATDGIQAVAWVGASASKAYNLPLTANTTAVKAMGYQAIATDPAGFSANGVRQYLTRYYKQRCRQAGTITQIQVRIASLTNITDVQVEFWRKVGTKYNLLAAESIFARIHESTTETITLTTPVALLEGDYYCIRLDATDSTAAIAAVDIGVANALHYTSDGAHHAGPQFNFDAESALTYVVPFFGYMSAPLVVGIGDSIMAYHGGYLGASEPDDQTKSILYKLRGLDARFTYQNMGVGGNTTTDMEARFAADCVALAPKYCIIMCGTNDVITDGSEATYTAKMTSCLDQCVAAGIIPVVCSVPPCTNGTDAQMGVRDTMHTAMRSLLNTSYPTAIYVELDNLLGQERSGHAGKLWDIQAAYDLDGVHLTEAGYAVVAEACYNAIFMYHRPVVHNKALFAFDRQLTSAEITALETLHTKL